jgi:hypothetical protein
MLIFVAPDIDRLEDLRQAARQLMAWRSIEQEKDSLNLDTLQRQQVKNGIDRSEETVLQRMGETYTWLLVPTQERPDDSTISWNITKISSDIKEPLPERVSKKLHSEEQLIMKWSPATLQMELDRLLWKDQPHIIIRKLWEYLCTYLYLPRLANEDVLLNAIVAGSHSMDYFGYADMVDDNGRYRGLVFGTGRSSVNNDGKSVLVKPEVAKKQFDDERAEKEKNQQVVNSDIDTGIGGRSDLEKSIPPTPKKMRRFHGSISLDPNRAGRDAGNIAESIIQYLNSEKDAQVEIVIEIKAHIPDGAQDNTMRTVSENCKVLKFKSFGFEEE